jgi:hypothetical protein
VARIDDALRRASGRIFLSAFVNVHLTSALKRIPDI